MHPNKDNRSPEVPDPSGSVPLDPSERFLRDLIEGLSRTQKTLPSKYFYDEEGSRLFDEITEQDEYYPTRTEMAILRDHIEEISACLGSRTLLVEYGSGSSLKTRILIEHLDQLAGYVPIDISKEHLFLSTEKLERDYPDLDVWPVHADYSSEVHIPVDKASYDRIVFFFPGSTIGNFRPGEAVEFLKRMGRTAGPGGGLLIGVDLKKDKQVLEAAYNDAAGVTAAFNLNVLERANREAGANFEVSQFEHRAHFNEEEGRIEMHLYSTRAQAVQIGPNTFTFSAGESIHTENSYKYTIPEFSALSERAEFKVERVWTDQNCYFSMQYLVTL